MEPFYLVYAKLSAETAELIVFIDDYDDACSWAKAYFDQYLDSTPDYVTFHWQELPQLWTYYLDDSLEMGGCERYGITNGFSEVNVVELDESFSSDFLMQHLLFDPSLVPWGKLLELHLDMKKEF